ncbi:MAG: carboxypeptidase-like regulatory domain-containing protein, partial [Bryobacteraceae bacterium]
MNGFRFLAGVACLVVIAGSASGQVTTGTILGDVRDASGAAIAGAKVTVTDTQKGTAQQYATDNSGSYYAPFLIPGTYRVSVEKEGFKRSVSEDLPLSVDQKARTDFTLAVGSVSETLEVTAATPLIHTETAELGEVVTERAIRTLPLNGRNFA